MGVSQLHLYTPPTLLSTHNYSAIFAKYQYLFH